MEEIKEEKVLEGRKLYRRYQLVRYERKKKRKKRGINELHSDETRVEYPLLSSLLRPSSKGMASTPCFKMNVIRGTRVEHDFSPSLSFAHLSPFLFVSILLAPFFTPPCSPYIYMYIYKSKTAFPVPSFHPSFDISTLHPSSWRIFLVEMEKELVIYVYLRFHADEETSIENSNRANVFFGYIYKFNRSS